MSRNQKNGSRPNQKPLIVSTLSERELRALNQCIIELLRTLQQQHEQQNMTKFRLGDVVRFANNGQKKVTGIIIRFNKKTVSVHSETGGQWTVSPNVLTLIKRQVISDEARKETSLIVS
ncbi:hypothetical protein [Phytobacter sp. V91]|uniref:hypothetical protein n=1 Tax=Phytobacter sp. V91 TaxID=3369425 RepID=UPI003F630AE4